MHGIFDIEPRRLKLISVGFQAPDDASDKVEEESVVTCVIKSFVVVEIFLTEPAHLSDQETRFASISFIEGGSHTLAEAGIPTIAFNAPMLETPAVVDFTEKSPEDRAAEIAVRFFLGFYLFGGMVLILGGLGQRDARRQTCQL